MITARPCVLIADDDPVSLQFVQTALLHLGCHAVAAADAAAAISLAGTNAFDLMLLDRCMPGCDGIELLRRLRRQGVKAPAVATSAELDGAIVRDLLAAGFVDTLLKPASIDSIRELLRRFALARNDAGQPQPGEVMTSSAPPLLDDAAALLAIGGDSTALGALRTLFVAELQALAKDLGSADDTMRASGPLIERMHRLRASCGFCGAPALGACAARLQDALRSGADTDRAFTEFLALCRATSRALAPPG